MGWDLDEECVGVVASDCWELLACGVFLGEGSYEYTVESAVEEDSAGCQGYGSLAVGVGGVGGEFQSVGANLDVPGWGVCGLCGCSAFFFGSFFLF